MNGTAKQALVTWFKAKTGLSVVLWAKQDAPRPAYPYGLLDVIARRDIGVPEVVYEYDVTEDPGEQMIPTYHVLKAYTVSCEVLSTSEETATSADTYLQAALNTLRHESVVLDFRDADMAYVSTANNRDMSEVVEGRFLSRWGADLQFTVNDSITPTAEQISLIESALVSSTFVGPADPTLFNWDDEEIGG